jgi:hypothetical protein
MNFNCLKCQAPLHIDDQSLVNYVANLPEQKRQTNQLMDAIEMAERYDKDTVTLISIAKEGYINARIGNRKTEWLPEETSRPHLIVAGKCKKRTLVRPRF